jgi:hypothetical protein
MKFQAVLIAMASAVLADTAAVVAYAVNDVSTPPPPTHNPN